MSATPTAPSIATSTAAIRPGRDGDAEGFIRLIGGCWAEYPGCVMDVDGEVPELRALASYYAGKGGTLWAAEDGAGTVVGMVATAPLGSDGAWEICKVYVARAQRGTGLAHRLLDGAERYAAGQGAQRLALWSDTRFDAAHRFYEKRGFVRSGPIRILGDLSNSLEFRYAKPLGPLAVEALDAAGAASAERALADILVACVDAGAAVSYLPPLAPEAARKFWRGVSSRVATGGCLLLAAWCDGNLVGTAQLGLDTPVTQPHRAELQKVLVHPGARRLGIGRALVRRAEGEAARIDRNLLTLNARAGDPAEALYRGLGWTEAGRIPEYDVDADGRLHDAVLFWRRV